MGLFLSFQMDVRVVSWFSLWPVGCGGPARLVLCPSVGAAARCAIPPLCRGGQWPPGAGKVPPCGGRSPSGGCLPGRGKVHFFFCGKRNGPSLLVGAKSAPLRFRLTAKTPFRFLAPPLPTKAALLWGPRARSSVSSGWNTAACVFTHCLGTPPGRYGHHWEEQGQAVVLSAHRLLVPLSGQSAAVPCVGRGALVCGARLPRRAIPLCRGGLGPPAACGCHSQGRDGRAVLLESCGPFLQVSLGQIKRRTGRSPGLSRCSRLEPGRTPPERRA